MPEPAKDKDKDKSAKWLIEHHGDAILRLGGVTDLVRWQAAPAELVLPTKLPDGLLFAWRTGRDHPEPFVVEIATYPELRAAEQALRDLLLVYLVRGEVANVLVLVLRPKGQLRVPDHARRPSSDAATELGGRWRVVELWTIPARASAGDGGSGDDALGAAHARGRTARDRAPAVPRGDRPARAGR